MFVLPWHCALYQWEKASNAHRPANQLYVKLLSSVLQGAEVQPPVVEVRILLQLQRTSAHVRWAKS